ncbi:fas-binding factor 1 [Mixophyes fleayi]|uniref:fas-binding factor 1 n=1 Tax=Mixophyes fleayi TaxID=3061075 RepID=UPI003F4DF36B
MKGNRDRGRNSDNASKSKTRFKDPIDDILGGLLADDDDDPSPSTSHKTRLLTTAPSSRTRPVPTKKSARDDDASFSQLAKKAAEESDVSDAVPQALLESMKDLDDMDAELFGSIKPKSAPSKGSWRSHITGSNCEPEEKTTGAKRVNSAPESETKQLSAPVGRRASLNRKFSLDDLDDPLEGILSDGDIGLGKKTETAGPKSVPEQAPVTTNVPEISSVVSPRRHHPDSRKKNGVNFETDTDDILDSLGFKDGPQSPQKEEGSAPKPARSQVDELLGRGTSAKLLERPPTGEKKEFKLDPKYQNMPEREDPLGDEGFAFGSYKPSVAFSPERRPSRRSSVRFSADGNKNLKSDARSHSTTPMVRSPAQGEKSGADWLGLKDEDDQNFTPSFPLKEPLQSSAVTPGSAGRSPAAAKTDNRPTPQPRASLIETPTVHKEDDWLSSVLSQKKAQKQETLEAQNHIELKETSGSSGPAVSVNTPQLSDSGKIVRDTMPDVAWASRTTLPWESPQKQSSSTPAASNHVTAPSSGPSEAHRDRVQPVPVPSKVQEGEKHDMEVLQSQNQVLDLQAQVRKLQRELEQQNLFVETLQQRHREDLELNENAHRNRLKLLEESASQREERLRLENQDLSVQYLARCQSAESEKTEMSIYQRKVTEFQQEKEVELKRIRELQRLSVQEMCRDLKEQLQRLKHLKDQEIDAVTSATSQTRSLNGIIEQMESFSHKLSDLSMRVDSTHINTSQEIELGARQREAQLQALQERLAQQQKDMEEERNNLRMIITNMETRSNEQGRLLGQERWKVSAEQAKVESLQHPLEEQRRIMTQQMAMGREELDRAKSFLLEEQQSFMKHCAEERRKLAAEWSEFHTQQKLSKEPVEKDISRAIMVETQREGAITSLAKEQAEVNQASELRKKEEQLALSREALEKERQDLHLKKKRVNATALRVRKKFEEVERLSKEQAEVNQASELRNKEEQLALSRKALEKERQHLQLEKKQVSEIVLDLRQNFEEIQRLSKLATHCYEVEEKALTEAKRVESGHLDLLKKEVEWFSREAEHMQQELINLAHRRRSLTQLYPNDPPHAVPNATFASSESQQTVFTSTSDFHVNLALFKLSAQRDREFIEDEKLYLEALRKSR